MIRRIALIGLTLLMCWFAEDVAQAAELQPPAKAVAGSELVIRTTGSGSATLYLVGPATRIKRKIHLGDEVRFKPEEITASGRFTAVVDGGGASTSFYVAPGPPAQLSFLARPSRVPAAVKDSVSGVVFTFDKNQNLVLQPETVKFDLTVAGGAPETRSVQTRNGVAYVIVDSGRKGGPAQFVASVGDVSATRIVQQVANEPCNLKMNARRAKDGSIDVETDPVRDCSGNAIPDGTIVTFIQVDPHGRSSVDARVKRGIARAQLPAADHATISVASGVVSGNEIRWGGGQ